MKDGQRPASSLIRIVLITALVLAHLAFLPASQSLSAQTSPPALPLSLAEDPPNTAVPGRLAQVLPPTLPVFTFLSPEVNETTALDLSGRLGGISSQRVFSDTSHANTLRFTIANEETGDIFEQYAASGGFFAYNATRAFAEENRGPFDPAGVRLLACNFLLVNELFPFEDVDQNALDCQNKDLPYDVIIARSTSQGAQAGASVAQIDEIAAIVQVPLSLDVGGEARIPLSGPGGHLSLLFTSTESDAPSLDDEVPGLAALAEPWYQRSREPLGEFPVVSAQDAIQQLQDSFPEGNIEPGTPELAYYVGHPAEPQEVLMPMWIFPDATAEIDGETVNLRSLMLPGVSGFLPTVEITSPTDGSLYTPGAAVTIAATISGGTAPYSYTLSLEDGTVLGEGTSTGAVSVTTDELPVISRAGPISTTLSLHAIDSNSAEALDTLTLRPSVAPLAYLPIIRSDRPGLLSTAPARAAPSDVTLAATNYRFGVEWVSDYNPPGPGGADLPGVPPDGNGFDSRMRSLGWDRAFRWTNYAAWEKDWRDCSLGGIDCSAGVDRADFVYFAGHGSPARIYFGSNTDSGSFFGGNARYQQVRWAGFATCQTLNVSQISSWFQAFQGAHMLLGYQSNMADLAFGGPLVDNMRIPMFLGIEFPFLQRSIREAWVLTVFQMNAGKPAYIYAVGTNGVNPVNNKLPKPNAALLARPFPVASWHWVWWE